MLPTSVCISFKGTSTLKTCLVPKGQPLSNRMKRSKQKLETRIRDLFCGSTSRTERLILFEMPCWFYFQFSIWLLSPTISRCGCRKCCEVLPLACPAVQVGLLTPLTFTQHHLSPLAFFTSGVYFSTVEGSDSETAMFTWMPRNSFCPCTRNLLVGEKWCKDTFFFVIFHYLFPAILVNATVLAFCTAPQF